MPSGGFGAQTGSDAPRPERIRATPYVWRDPRSIPPRQWLYGRHYVRGYVTATVAPGGLGKSSLALVEAIAMAAGRNLLGSPVPRPLRVWYVNLEDPREELDRRVAAICLHFRIKPEDLTGRLYIDTGRETPIIIAEKIGERIVVNGPAVQEVLDEVRDLEIDALILDPFVSSHRVPENDNGAIDAVAKTWAKIADQGSCCIELIHHVRKPSGGQQSEFTVDDARGAVSLIGAVRSARVLNVMSKEEADQAGVEQEKRKSHFRIDDGKANMKPPIESAEWRKLVSVGLSNATDDDPEDWVGVVTEWTMPGLLDDVQVADLRKIQERIAGAEWAENVQAANWAGVAVADVLGLDASDKADRKRIGLMLRTWVKSGALKVARRHDTRKGRDVPMVVVGERV